MNFDDSTDVEEVGSLEMSHSHTPAALPGRRVNVISNDVLIERNDVQSLIIDGFDDMGGPGNDGTSLPAGLATTSREYFHHQMLEVEDGPVRPAARRGRQEIRGEGRLGIPVSDNPENSAKMKSLVKGKANMPYRASDSDGAVALSDVVVDDAASWDAMLQSMARIDMTLMSCFYVGHDTVSDDTGINEKGRHTEVMIKTFSPFYYKCSTGMLNKERTDGHEGGAMALDTLRRLVSHMRSVQLSLTEKGLLCNTKGSPGSHKLRGDGEEADANGKSDRFDHTEREEEVVCRGTHSIHVDSSCRLIGVVDVDSCTVSLADIIAHNFHPFSQDELAVVVKSIVNKLVLVHDAGVAHGCLHAGNVLCGTDRGYVCLTSPCAVLSNPLFPADASFISPRRAVAMKPLVDLLTSGTPEGKVEGVFSWTCDPVFHHAVLECFGCVEGSDICPNTNDDVYAVGILTLSCLLGVPPLCTATLREVVYTLAPYYEGTEGSCEEKGNVSLLLGGLFSSTYLVQRTRLAGYSSDFVSALMDFVGFCLRAGVCVSGGEVVTATDLLKHPFLTNFDDSLKAGTAAYEENAPNDETIGLTQGERILHRLSYNALVALEAVRSDCGTTPFVPRLCRNSIFTARLNALQASPLSKGGDSDTLPGDDAIGVNWPQLDMKSPHWRVQLRDSAKYWQCGLYNSPSTLRHPSFCTNEDDISVVLEVFKSKGLRLDTDAHTLVWQNKINDRLVLHKAEVTSGYLETADTLILRNLRDCVLEVLLRFRHIVLINVKGCELLFGPCYFCYCNTLSDCSSVAIASAHLVVHDIKRVNFYLGFCASPRCHDNNSQWEDVCISPYCIAYEGLSADYAAVPLPQEHVATVMPSENEQTPQELIKGTLELCSTLGRGQDYPYSHALAAFGSRFIHEDDNVSDVFLYPLEVRRKSIQIARIHGGGGGSPARDGTRFFTSDVTRHRLWQSRHHGTYDDMSLKNEEAKAALLKSGAERVCPIIFILDIVSDCVIRDCSNCTVVILGSTETIMLQRCSNMKVFLIGREIVLEDCNMVEAYVIATELLLLSRCKGLDIFPLAVRVPCIEEILDAVVGGCEDESLQEELLDALQGGDITNLNAVTRCENDPQAISMQGCENVKFDGTSPLMFTVDFVFTDTEPSTFFFSAWSGSRNMNDWVVVPLTAHVYGATDITEDSVHVLPPVRFHDLVNVALPRVSGTISGRVLPSRSTTPPPLVEVVFERIAMGMVHIDDAIETLFIRKCTGPLEIAVFAAKRIIMESCEHVTVHAACCTLLAVECHACHTALHVNAMPRYVDCTGMQASTANIASSYSEAFLERAGVLTGVNAFSEPVVKRSNAPQAGTVHSPDMVSNMDSIESVEMAFAVLHNPVTLVPPRALVNFGCDDVPLIDAMASCVTYEESTRKTFDASMIAALMFLSSRTPEENYTDELSEVSVVEEVSISDVVPSSPPLPTERTPLPLSPKRHVDPHDVRLNMKEERNTIAGNAICPEPTPYKAVARTSTLEREEKTPADASEEKDDRKHQVTAATTTAEVSGDKRGAPAAPPCEKATKAIHDIRTISVETTRKDYVDEKNERKDGEEVVRKNSEEHREDLVKRTTARESSAGSAASAFAAKDNTVDNHTKAQKKFELVVHPSEVNRVRFAVARAVRAADEMNSTNGSRVTALEQLQRRAESAINWLRSLRR
uniref:C-CAP/cofactor C-like domain-containing protein n=1 Tax=Trypanosoma congolense (strain IL3000) TaxID=1068625 RepID=G0UYQ8_TRYCI|nr:conserved hypothetical protein [Trypanosoma congolense IL3000]